MSIIQIQHLYKTFGTGENAVHALEDISLDIQKGRSSELSVSPAPARAPWCGA